MHHHANYEKTRLFYLTCEHVLFVYILKQRKKFRGFKKQFANLKNLNFFTKLKTFERHFFKNFYHS